MLKNTIIAAGALAAAVFAFQPQQAEAGTKFQFHLGVGAPYYGYYGGPAYYGGPVYYGRPAYRPRPRYRIGCRQARRLLRNRGFHQIRTRDCNGKRYSFKARRHGNWWIVKVNSNSGRILRIRPI